MKTGLESSGDLPNIQQSEGVCADFPNEGNVRKDSIPRMTLPFTLLLFGLAWFSDPPVNQLPWLGGYYPKGSAET